MNIEYLFLPLLGSYTCYILQVYIFLSYLDFVVVCEVLWDKHLRFSFFFANFHVLLPWHVCVWMAWYLGHKINFTLLNEMLRIILINRRAGEKQWISLTEILICIDDQRISPTEYTFSIFFTIHRNSCYLYIIKYVPH